MSELERRYEEAKEISVYPLNMKDVEDSFNKEHQRKDGWYYDFNRPLAVIDANGKRIVTDHECVYYVPDKDGLYRIPVWGRKGHGTDVKSASVFPIGDAVYDWNEIASFHEKDRKTLDEFMGGRYKYNSRIESNTSGLINFLNKTTKKPKARRTKK